MFTPKIGFKGLHIIYWGYGTGNIAYRTTIFLWRQAYRATTFFSTHMYGARTFLTETESCSGDSWWLYLSGKNDILMTILPKPRFYATVVVSRSWWDPFRMLIWLHLGPLTIPVWFYKDPTQILDKFPKVSYHVWKLIHLWSRIDSTDRAEKCLRL